MRIQNLCHGNILLIGSGETHEDYIKEIQNSIPQSIKFLDSLTLPILSGSHISAP